MSDIHLIPGAAATAAERDAIDRAIGEAETGRRDLLLPALHAAQSRIGWISEGALNHICDRLSVPPAEAYGVATFYAMFALKPRPAHVVHVCDDIACKTRGADAICRTLTEQVGPASEPVNGGKAMWLRSPCLGLCEQAPVALVQSAGEPSTDVAMASTSADEIMAALRTPSSSIVDRPSSIVPTAATVAVPQAREPRDGSLKLLARVGVADPESLDEYRAHGGYAALRRAFDIGPEQVIREVVDAKLVGRGGAAFPSGRKWEAVARAPVRPHYLVCNADESEPGTFKDRVIMEEDPFALVEAMTIAGYATGCEQGFIYVRAEYPLATSRLQNAIDQARRRGLLGANVMNEGVHFDLELRRGAGAYICGEETALFNSIEGKRGEPRNKPPFPVQSGLFNKPTVINNVETLVNVPHIILAGGPAFSATGTAGSTGTKLFCLSGCVTTPGLYEAPFGITLRQLIEKAGGVAGGKKLRAILLGGAAGVFVTPDELDMPLTFEGTRAAGATLGSGVIMLFDDTIDLHSIVMRIASFFRDESCGQCVPCRIGTIRQEEALHRLGETRGSNGAGAEAELVLMRDLAQVMTDASICGLGQTAASAVQSALKKLQLYPAGGSR